MKLHKVMKQVALLMLGLILAPAVAAQTEASDTIKVIENAQRVMVTRNADKTVVSAIIGNPGDAQFRQYTYEVSVSERADTVQEDLSESLISAIPFLAGKKRNGQQSQPRKSKRYVTALRNIYWGWNFAYAGKGAIRNCFEVGVAEVISVAWHPWRNGPDFRVGAGFGMKRFLTAGNTVFGKETDCLTMHEIDPGCGACDVKSRWDVWTFHLPLMISQRIVKGVGVAAGALVNFNTYSKARSQMEIEGVRYTETFKGLQQRLVTVELVGMFGLRGGIGIYAKWSPMPLMRTAYGPEFKTWSLGATLNF